MTVMRDKNRARGSDCDIGRSRTGWARRIADDGLVWRCD